MLHNRAITLPLVLADHNISEYRSLRNSNYQKHYMTTLEYMNTYLPNRKYLMSNNNRILLFCKYHIHFYFQRKVRRSNYH